MAIHFANDGSQIVLTSIPSDAKVPVHIKRVAAVNGTQIPHFYRTISMKRFLPLSLFLAVLAPAFATTASAQWAPLNPVQSFQNGSGGVEFKMASGTLKLLVCSDSIIRVLYSPTNSFADRPDYLITKKDWPAVQWKVDATDKDVTLARAIDALRP